ncbi:unnamed protein product [Phytophthora fragariaefolia]|uniref:Unnamed protein product n=1 Tax=Phytophthora fragariaefolia TaxID=1490495 RepID=A0A9W6Y2N6_9STRA|nr:unnamed protein product [Phytophthora fragariaefolia]
MYPIASAKPKDSIVPNPDTSGQLIPTSPHVIDEDDPTSSPSSSGSRRRTSIPGRGCNEAWMIQSALIRNGRADDGDVDEGDADETKSNHSVYNGTATLYVHVNDTPYLSLLVSYILLDDLNIVRPGEKPEDFVRVDSDDENEVNSVYDDDGDLGPTCPLGRRNCFRSELSAHIAWYCGRCCRDRPWQREQERAVGYQVQWVE